MLSKYKAYIIIGAMLAVMAIASFVTDNYVSNKYEAQIAEQKKEAAQTLAIETDKVLKAERRLSQVKDQIEVINVINQKAVDDALATNRKLIATAGGLRDPGRRANSNCSMPSNTITAHVIETAGKGQELSGTAQEFLLTFAADADRVVEQYESCQRWLTELTKDSKPVACRDCYQSSSREKLAMSDYSGYLAAHLSEQSSRRF